MKRVILLALVVVGTVALLVTGLGIAGVFDRSDGDGTNVVFKGSIPYERRYGQSTYTTSRSVIRYTIDGTTQELAIDPKSLCYENARVGDPLPKACK